MSRAGGASVEAAIDVPRLRDIVAWPLAGLVIVATAWALGHPGQGGTEIRLPTVAGDIAVYLGSGLYAHDPVAVAREALVWDGVNLLIGVPALLVAAASAARGSSRGRLVTAGLAAYFTYVYLMYATMSALNPLFFVYAAIVATGASTTALHLAGLDPRAVAAALPLPRRLVVGYLLGTATLLVALWTARVAAILATGHFPPALAGMATLETQAIDLGLVVPFLAWSAILLWRRSPWGTPLAAMALAFGAMLDLAIPAWIVSGLRAGGGNWREALPMLLVSAAGVALAVLALRRAPWTAR